MLLSLLRAFKTPGTQVAPQPPVEPAAGALPAAPHADAVPDAPAQAVAAEAPADDPFVAAQQAEQRGDIEGMLDIHRRHVRDHPDENWAIAHLGGQLVQHGRLDEAAAVLLPAVQRFPGYAPLLFNAGRIAQAHMRIDEAIRFYRLALAAEPGFAMARLLLSAQLLIKGDYREGMLHFRARNELAETPNRDWPREIPKWEGQSLHDKRLLVWLDWGGLGDELQFARYLEPLSRQYRPGRLILGCSREGKRLYERIPGVDEASSLLSGTQVDYQVALLDLPILFQTTLDNMPPAAPYLHAPAAETAAFGTKLSGLPGRKIGLCWGSGFWGRTTRGDKAIPLDLLSGLAGLPDASFISLQKGPARAELPCPGLDIHDFDDDLHDMADTAALIANLDLVISVDTAVAHLAGAMGKPVLMLLKWESGNFWLLDREDSPWYPSMRIVRQRSSGDWEGVAAQLLDILSTPETAAQRTESPLGSR